MMVVIFMEIAMTVTGKTMKENLKKIKFNPKQKVLRKYDNPLSPDGGVVGLKVI